MLRRLAPNHCFPGIAVVLCTCLVPVAAVIYFDDACFGHWLAWWKPCSGKRDVLAPELLSIESIQGKTKGQQLKSKVVSYQFFILFHTLSHFFRIFPPGLSLLKQRVLAQWEQKRREDNKNNWTHRCCTLVVTKLLHVCPPPIYSGSDKRPYSKT